MCLQLRRQHAPKGSPLHSPPGDKAGVGQPWKGAAAEPWPPLGWEAPLFHGGLVQL